MTEHVGATSPPPTSYPTVYQKTRSSLGEKAGKQAAHPRGSGWTLRRRP